MRRLLTISIVVSPLIFFALIRLANYFLLSPPGYSDTSDVALDVNETFEDSYKASVTDFINSKRAFITSSNPGKQVGTDLHVDSCVATERSRGSNFMAPTIPRQQCSITFYSQFSPIEDDLEQTIQNLKNDGVIGRLDKDTDCILVSNFISYTCPDFIFSDTGSFRTRTISGKQELDSENSIIFIRRFEYFNQTTGFLGCETTIWGTCSSTRPEDFIVLVDW